jgi:two-component system NtrC family response regulator/two-component system nitrogen regulation response regulator GlnG
LGDPRRRILLVDDEQDILDVLHEHFAKECDVETAADGMTALAIVRARRPDVIFLDINMPGINGVDVLKSVKELDATIPVLMVTANADNALAAEAIKRGAFSYVPKPFDLKYLDHLVAAALSSRAGRNR